MAPSVDPADYPLAGQIDPSLRLPAGADGSLDAVVDNCYTSCEFEWYVDGVLVWTDTASDVADVAADPALFFTASSTLLRTYAAGTYAVTVRVTDALDRSVVLSTSVVAAAPDVPPTDAASGMTGGGGAGRWIALAVLWLVSAIAIAIARHPRPGRTRG